MKLLSVKTLITIILSLSLSITTLSIVLINTSNNKNIMDKQTSNISDKQLDIQTPNLLKNKEDDYFELTGYGQLQIDENYPNINLTNSSENKIYLSYDVCYKDEVLYSTKLIEPGKMEQYNIYNMLDAGQHTLDYSINVYDTNENVLWSGIKQQQEILIVK